MLYVQLYYTPGNLICKATLGFPFVWRSLKNIALFRVTGDCEIPKQHQFLQSPVVALQRNSANIYNNLRRHPLL